MQLVLPFGYYKKALQAASNDALSLAKLLEPFGLKVGDQIEDKSLCIGLIVDDLSEFFDDEAWVDPFDIARVAWEHDFRPAWHFLDEAPLLIWQLFKDATSG